MQILLIMMISAFNGNFLYGRSKYIYTFVVAQIKMKVKVITSKDKQLLAQIKEVLKTKWHNSKVNPEESCKLFDQLLAKNANEYIYGVLLNEKNELMIVASLFLQYKLTRGLSQIYHLQIDYKRCTKQEELFFQSQIVELVPGYKITGLHVTESQYFPPHQIYMEIDLQKSSNLKGSL